MFHITGVHFLGDCNAFYLQTVEMQIHQLFHDHIYSVGIIIRLGFEPTTLTVLEQCLTNKIGLFPKGIRTLATVVNFPIS